MSTFSPLSYLLLNASSPLTLETARSLLLSSPTTSLLLTSSDSTHLTMIVAMLGEECDAGDRVFGIEWSVEEGEVDGLVEAVGSTFGKLNGVGMFDECVGTVMVKPGFEEQMNTTRVFGELIKVREIGKATSRSRSWTPSSTHNFI